MKKAIRVVFFIFLFLTAISNVSGQERMTGNEDAQLKEDFYKKYKREVRQYDKNDFDALFFEFFKKQKDKSVTLTKEEFYTYTVKIAIYSEKLGLLYKNQKADAERTKQEWFSRSYSDYLNSKK